MVLLLIPLAAFFSAVCLSLAVLARSMKEGQYYMTPLYLVCLPLIFLTLCPGIELNLFYSLVPITGVALLLRALILGNYDLALPVLPAGAGADPGLRGGRAALGDRPVPARGCPVPRGRAVQPLVLAAAPASATASPRPTGGQATLCFALILTSSWFLMQYLAFDGDTAELWPAWSPGSSFILFPPLFDGGPADVVARGGRSGSPGPSRATSCWPLRWPLTLNPAGQRAAADRRVALPDLVDGQGALGQLMAQSPSLGVAVCRLRPGPGRSARSSRSAASSSPGWSASTGPGRRSCSRPDVRVPPRAA